MKLTSKSQVTIPKKIREAAGIKPGDDVEFKVKPGKIIELMPMRGKFSKWVGFSGRKSEREIDARIKQMRGRT